MQYFSSLTKSYKMLKHSVVYAMGKIGGNGKWDIGTGEMYIFRTCWKGLQL